MSRSILPALVFLLALTSVFAASYTDTLEADFALGNLTLVNGTNDSIELPLVAAATYNTSGTFESQVFDLGSMPANVTISWGYSTPTGTSILVSTRSGNTSSVGSSWSSYANSYSTSTGSAVTSPTNRYYQYRLQLATTVNTSTPVVTDVTLAYNETNTSISAASSTANLTTLTSGAYNFIVNVTDTYSVLSVTGRYQYGANTSMSTSAALDSAGTNLWNLSIPMPGNWTSYSNTNLTLEVTATVSNGSTNTTQARNVTERIDFQNTVPLVDPITNVTLAQGATMNFTVTATDYDSQNLSFVTNESGITVTALTNTSARLTWTPNATEVGVRTVTVTALDGYGNGTRMFVVNVSNTNDAPVLATIADITGYHGIRQAITLSAYDADTTDTLSFSMSPSFFSISAQNDSNGSSSSGTTYGILNFTPADDEHGTQNVTFFVTDGTESDNQTVSMTIGYCGDLTCQTTYETSTTCPVDCDTTAPPEQIALIIPDRNCVNTSVTMHTFNATNRFSCYYEGLVEDGFALCEALDSVTVRVFLRDGYKLTEKASLSSDTDGTASFTPASAGEYKVTATKDGFANTTKLIYVRDCSSDIVIVQQNTTVTQPTPPPVDEDEGSQPSEEEPGVTLQEASLLTILLFYVAVPTLLALLVYAGSVFYDVNKDTLPWLLEARIFLYEKRVAYDPQIRKAQATLDPYLRPVGEALGELYGRTLKPLIDRLKKGKQ